MFSAWPRRERACPRQSLGPAHTRTVTGIAIVAILTIPTGVATIPAIPTTTDRPLSVAPSSFSMAAVIITIMTAAIMAAVTAITTDPLAIGLLFWVDRPIAVRVLLSRGGASPLRARSPRVPRTPSGSVAPDQTQDKFVVQEIAPGGNTASRLSTGWSPLLDWSLS